MRDADKKCKHILLMLERQNKWDLPHTLSKEIFEETVYISVRTVILCLFWFLLGSCFDLKIEMEKLLWDGVLLLLKVDYVAGNVKLSALNDVHQFHIICWGLLIPKKGL